MPCSTKDLQMLLSNSKPFSILTLTFRRFKTGTQTQSSRHALLCFGLEQTNDLQPLEDTS